MHTAFLAALMETGQTLQSLHEVRPEACFPVCLRGHSRAEDVLQGGDGTKRLSNATRGTDFRMLAWDAGDAARGHESLGCRLFVRKFFLANNHAIVA